MPASRSVAHLDPRAPLVLDTRELGRRAGSMRTRVLTIPAPAGWGLELIEVPPGEEVHLDLRLEAVVDGVLVTAAVTAPVRAECGRCLEPVRDEVEVHVQELFAYEEDPAGDGDVSLMVGDLIDFEQVVRDAVVLGLPLNPVCAQDCAGLCPGCGEALSELSESHNHDEVDPRWASLTSLDNETPEMGS
jgi:uncharacterized protein